jgi:hypothetical protein
MKKRLVALVLAVGVMLTILSLAGVIPRLGQAQGQTEALSPTDYEVCRPYVEGCRNLRTPSILAPPPPNWSMPRTRDGKPDFTGVYAGPGFTHQIGPDDTNTPLIRGYNSKLMPPMVPGGEKILFRPTTGDTRIDDPIALCLPYGFTSQFFSPYAQQLVQAPNHLVIKHEFMNNWSRIIPLDGRPHPSDLELTWGGHSVGRWESDTLVIDTVGLREWWLDNPHPKGSLWHSDAMHVIERMKWLAPQVVSLEITLDDPKIWTKPWTEQFHMVRHRSWQLLEYVCLENDRCAGGNCVESDVQKQ